MSIKEIRNRLEQSLVFVQKLTTEAERQEKLLADLKKSSEIAKRDAERDKTMVKEINALSAVQIEAIKQVITEDAKNESTKGFWLGVLISLPIGFACSLAASFMFHRLTKKIDSL